MYELIKGDAIQCIKRIEDSSVDAVITDPPYSSGGCFRSDRAQTTGVKYTQTGEKKRPFLDFPGDNRDQRSYLTWLTLVLSECYRVSKFGGAICLFTDWRQLPTVSDALQAAGFVWRGIYVWDKTQAARPRLGFYRQQAEFVVWGTKGAMGKRVGRPALPGLTTCSVNRGGRYHQTGKPIVVMRDLVRICDPGGIVLDPFAGSGSTGVACAEEGYKFRGVEYTEHYSNIARDRLKEAYKKWESIDEPAPTIH